MNKETPAGAILLLLTLLCPAAPVRAEDGLEKKLPPLENLVRYGCTIHAVRMVDHDSPRNEAQQFWRVAFWAEHQGPFDEEPDRDWKLLYSYRKKRMKAFVDCDDFMERVKRVERQKSVPEELAERKSPQKSS